VPFNFCPKCGSKLPPTTAPFAPQPCVSCGSVHYHNSLPCAGALVIKNRRVLLVRRAIEPFRDFWDIPGGFLEPGEHPEDGARRELQEETGLVISLTGLHRICMDRYGPDGQPTLNIYYLAEPVAGDERPANDVSELGWFSSAGLPEQIAFLHTPQVLADWSASMPGLERQPDHLGGSA